MAKNPARIHLGNKGRKGRKKAPVEARDHGTPELAKHRLRLVKEGDPALSTCWIDVVYANKIISERQWRAGAQYSSLRYRLFGMGVTQGEPDHRNPIPEGIEKKLREEYELADKVLRRQGDQVHWNTRALAVDNLMPSWFHHRAQPYKDRLDSVKTGLTTLANHFRI